MAKCPLMHQNCSNQCAWNVKGVCVTAIIAKALAKAGEDVSASVSKLSEGMDVLALSAMEPKQETQKHTAAKLPRVITDDELDGYVAKINVLDIANVTTSETYETFVKWCEGRGLAPCPQRRLTNRICSHHPFTLRESKFVPIRRDK